MARFWLGPWVWESGALPHWRMPTGAIGLVDLRSVAACAMAGTVAGFGLFTTPDAIDLGSDYENLGTDPLLPWTAQAQNRWRSALQLPQTLAANNLREAIWETLTVQADPIGDDRAPPLMPSGREWQLWLGGQVIARKDFALSEPEAAPTIDLLKRNYRKARLDSLAGHHRDQLGQVSLTHYRKMLGYWAQQYGISYRNFQPTDVPDESPLTPATTLNDNFNRADQSGLGTASGGFTWSNPIGSSLWDIVSNQAQYGTGDTGEDVERAESDLSGVDCYCQIKVVEVHDGSGGASFISADTIARKDSTSTATYYLGQSFIESSISHHRLYKNVASSFTELGSNTDSISANEVQKLSCNGTTIKLLIDGVEKFSVTDSDISTGTRCGIRTDCGDTNSYSIADDFQAADLAVVPAQPYDLAHSPQHQTLMSM